MKVISISPASKVNFTALVFLLFRDSGWKWTYSPAEMWLLALMSVSAVCELLLHPDASPRLLVEGLRHEGELFAALPGRHGAERIESRME